MKASFIDALKREYWELIFVAIASSIWVIACLFVLNKEFILSKPGMFLILAPVFGLLLWFSEIYKKARKDFWQQLALKYNWDYVFRRDVADEKALLFHAGHSPSVQNGISGNYNNHPFFIFEYEYSVGYGKSRRTHSCTVFEIKFKGTFPHIYLNYKNDYHSNPPSFFASLGNIPVPTEFEKQFKLYAPEKYEQETLQIFTSEIFALLIDSEWKHDMEFVDGELIIYREIKFDNFTSLDSELTQIKKFIDILAPRLNHSKLAQIGDLSPLLTE